MAPTNRCVAKFRPKGHIIALNRQIIEASNIKKKYGPATEVLKGVSLSVKEGDFLSLMGSSGSGKTTLLNLIGGLDTPDQGTLEVIGKNIQSLPDKERSAFRLRHIGFVFQFFNLLPTLSVRENIALPLLLLENSEKTAQSEARSIAEEVGLGEKTERRIDQLSGGEMQRVAIARAIVHRPQLLLADEPTGNLDTKTGKTILTLLRKVAESHGLTVLMVTHDPKAAALCDRVVHMQDGQIIPGD